MLVWRAIVRTAHHHTIIPIIIKLAEKRGNGKREKQSAPCTFSSIKYHKHRAHTLSERNNWRPANAVFPFTTDNRFYCIQNLNWNALTLHRLVARAMQNIRQPTIASGYLPMGWSVLCAQTPTLARTQTHREAQTGILVVQSDASFVRKTSGATETAV